jgi:hypothetical protein
LWEVRLLPASSIVVAEVEVECGDRVGEVVRVGGPRIDAAAAGWRSMHASATWDMPTQRSRATASTIGRSAGESKVLATSWTPEPEVC